MSGMYMSEWPMFGTKDPNLGSSTDLLFDRDFIFGAFATCLIQGGYPVGATFERTGDILRDGVTFAADTPVVQGGKYHHNGQFTNEVVNIDFFASPSKVGIVDTGDTVPFDVGGVTYNITKFAISNTGFIGQFLGNFDGPLTGDFRIWSNCDCDIGVRVGNPTSTGSSTIFSLTSGYNDLTLTESYPAAVNHNIVIDNRDSATVGLELAAIVQATKTPYSIAPIYIPTSGSTASIDTAASQPNPDKHGLNWENTEPKNDWVFDLLSSGSGTMSFRLGNVVPAVDQWKTSGDFNVLSGDTSGVTSQIFYIEPVTGLVCATDGTNISKSVQPYVAGSDSQVSLAFGDSKMQIYVDGVNGTQVPFVGTFTPGETLKWGLNNEDIFSIGNVCGQTTSSFSESVHLAEELAYDL